MPKWGDQQLRGIQKKGLKYWYRQELKPELREKFGKRNFLVPLDTEDLAVAIVRAAEAREQLQRMLNPDWGVVTWEDHIRANIDRLDEYAEETRIDTGPGTGDPDRASASELVDALETMRGYDAAKRFHDVSHGLKTPIEPLLESYARERDASQSNLRDKAWAIKRAGVKFLEDVPDKKTAAAITSELMKDDDLKRSSVAAIARNLSALWSHAENQGLVENNPWQNLRIKKLPSTKRALTVEELQTIMRETAGTKLRYRAEVLFLLCHTSLRAGELIELTVDDVEWDGDQPVFLVIRDAKTEAGNRRVPIARVCRPIVTRMFHDNHKSKLYRWSYGKLWEDMRALYDDFLPEAKTLDVHSARRATVTACERSELPEALAAAIAGHKHKTMTYGHYSAGPSDEMLLEAAEKVAGYFKGDEITSRYP